MNYTLNFSGAEIDERLARVETITPRPKTATLTLGGWVDNQQTISVNGVTTNSKNIVLVSPSPESLADYSVSGVYASAVGNGTITFVCETVPENAINLNIVVSNGL